VTRELTYRAHRMTDRLTDRHKDRQTNNTDRITPPWRSHNLPISVRHTLENIVKCPTRDVKESGKLILDGIESTPKFDQF